MLITYKSQTIRLQSWRNKEVAYCPHLLQCSFSTFQSLSECGSWIYRPKYIAKWFWGNRLFYVIVEETLENLLKWKYWANKKKCIKRITATDVWAVRLFVVCVCACDHCEKLTKSFVFHTWLNSGQQKICGDCVRLYRSCHTVWSSVAN